MARVVILLYMTTNKHLVSDYVHYLNLYVERLHRRYASLHSFLKVGHVF